MATVDSGSSARRQTVHTETRTPAEVIWVRVVYYVFGVIEVILAMRFVLLLLGANKEAGFVSFVHNLSTPFMVPFDAVFKTQSAAGSSFELSSLLALAVYALIGWGIVSLIQAVSPRRSSQTVERVEKSEDTETQV
ncbi:MAG TPA: hypothetical protein VIL15_01800 [Coriobacteriia bacterium]